MQGVSPVMMRLMSQMNCTRCGSSAPLVFQTLSKTLEDGTIVNINGVPMYQCTACGHTQMELLSRGALEELLQDFIDTHLSPSDKKVELRLEWKPADHPGSVRQALGIQSRVPVRAPFELAFA